MTHSMTEDSSFVVYRLGGAAGQHQVAREGCDLAGSVENPLWLHAIWLLQGPAGLFFYEILKKIAE